MIKIYNIDYKELSIDKSRIGRLLGYKQIPMPELIQVKLDEVLSEASKYLTIRGGYTIPDFIFLNKKEKCLDIAKVSFKIEKIIYHQLKDAEKLAVFLCTTGKGIEEWSRRLLTGDDPVKGYIIDLVGSEIVETAMDIIQEKLRQEMALAGLNISNRYSPGYCGWNVSEQHKLFSFFPENFCGVSLTESALMTPIKSVSGIIGIGKKIVYNNYSCKLCDMKNCIYRNRKTK